MKLKRLAIVSLLLSCLMVLAFALTLSLSEREIPLYRETILPSLGGSYTFAWAINDRGQVAGTSRVPGGDWHLFLWDRYSGMHDLGPVASEPVRIDQNGQIVATARDPNGHARAFVWDPNTGRTVLPTLGGDSVQARAMNNLGHVIGVAKTASGVDHAFIWDAVHGIHDLTPSDSGGTSPWSLNDAGQVVVSTRRGSFLLHTMDGQVVASEPLPLRQLTHLNNPGRIAGLSRTVKGWADVVVWRSDSDVETVGRLRGGDPGMPRINDVGQVHFWQERRPAITLPRLRQFSAHTENYLWDPRRGRIPLDVCVSLDAGDYLTFSDVNNHGALVGVVHRRTGRSEGILLEPIPERWDEYRADDYSVQGLRIGRWSRRLASSSWTNSSLCGSQWSLRPRRIARSSRWQIVSERTAVSTGQMVLPRVRTHSRKFRL